jgi:hypothetical protein
MNTDDKTLVWPGIAGRATDFTPDGEAKAAQ